MIAKLLYNHFMSISLRLKLGKNIKSLRLEAKLTQEQLAELSGVGYKHIQEIEGKHPASTKIDTLEKIAKALRTTPANLLE